MFFFKQAVYRFFNSKMLAAGLLVLAAVWAAVPAYAVNDQLRLPAKKSIKAPKSLLLDIVNTGMRLVAVGERGHIVYSDDNGKQWNQAQVPVSVTLTAVHFPTPLKGWAVGHDTVVLHSEDGGQNWTVQLDGFKANQLNLTHAKALLEQKKARLASVLEADRDRFLEDLDNLEYEVEGMTANVEEKICCDPLMDVWFKDEQTGFVIGAYGQIYHTRDSGKTWTPWWDRVDNPDRFHLNAIVQAKGALFIAGEAGTLYRSLDDGKSFQALASPYGGSFFGIIASPEAEYVMAFGLSGNMVHSNDLGNSWQHVRTPAGAPLAAGIVKKDQSVALVSYSGVILEGSGETGVLVPRKVGRGWTGIAQAQDGRIVLSGMGGVHRPVTQ